MCAFSSERMTAERMVTKDMRMQVLEPSLECNAVVWGGNGVEVLASALQTTSPGNVSKAYFWEAETYKHKYQPSKNIFTFLTSQLGIQILLPYLSIGCFWASIPELASLPRDIGVNKGCSQRCRTVSQTRAQSLNTILHSSREAH